MADRYRVQKKERVGLILTIAEKNMLIRLTEIEGGLSQAALIRRLIRKAAIEQGICAMDYPTNDKRSTGILSESTT
jgi:hypothetical protein